MTLKHLLEAYDFDEIMPAIVDMFPGTGSYRNPLEKAYNILVSMTPIPSKKTIRYKVMEAENNESYVGAEDSCFTTTWEVCLGKEIVKERGVDLSQLEIAANALINVCFLGKHPAEFKPFFRQLHK